MFDSDEGPKDWEEIPEEHAPESLQRKWIEEDLKPKPPAVCPACGKEVPPDSLTCLFCGAQIYGTEPDIFHRLMCRLKKFFTKKFNP